MASSGFSGFVPFFKGIINSGSKAATDQAAIRLLTLPKDLQSTSQPIRVEGEVIAKGPERVLFLRTDRGDIEVRANEARRFEVGQRVQLDIPAGRPPREALITKTNELSQTNSLAKTAESSSLASSIEKSSVTLSREAKLQTTVLREINETKEAAKIQPARLPPETLVRLTQLPRQIAEQALKNVTEQILSTVKLQAVPSGQIIPATELVLAQSPLITIPQSLNNFASFPVSQASATVTASAKALFQNITGGRQENTNLSFISRAQPQPFTQNQAGGITRFTPEQVQARLGNQTQIPQGIMGHSRAFTTEQFPSQILNRLVTTLQNNQQGQISPAVQIDGRVTGANIPTQYTGPQWGGQIQQGSILTQGRPDALTFRVAGVSAEGFPLLSPVGGQFSNNGTAPNLFLLNFPMKDATQGALLQISPQSMQIVGSTAIGNDPWNLLFTHMRNMGTSPSPLQMSLQSLLPQASAPTKIVPSILFLFAALQGGSLEGLAGTKSLQDLKESKTLRVLDALMKEGASSSRFMNTVSGDWRAWTFPMQYQENLVPINLYVQNQGSEGGQSDEQEDSDATRFLFEFDLTRMGVLQIDGMMREANLDIFIRTEKEVSSEMKTVLKGLYLKALDKSELTGDIAFQTKDKGWVDLSEPLENNFRETVT